MGVRYSIRYIIALVPVVLALFGNIFSVWYAIADLIWMMIIMVALDWLLKPSSRKPPEFDTGMLPNFILLLSAMLNIVVIATLLVGIANETITGWKIPVCTLVTGINSGFAGFITAHELIHRKTKFERTLGQMNLLAGNYMHFYIDHIHGHHRMVGREDDHVTAKYGESLYQYIARTVPMQWWNALRIEVKRIKKEGNENPYGLSNYVMQTSILQLCVLAAIAVFFGTEAFLAFIIQNMIGVFLLEYVNYIEHYGLVRNEHEKITGEHSWHTDAPGSRMSLFELNRHADHHVKASKHFYTLHAHDNSPTLPSGYFGMFPVALFPKWWFRMVNPLIPGKFLPK